MIECEGFGCYASLPQRVTHLSAGVGFCVAYAPLRSPQLWLVGTDSFLLSSTNPQSLQLPASAGTVKQVACGLAHGIVLATTGEGIVSHLTNCLLSPNLLNCDNIYICIL